MVIINNNLTDQTLKPDRYAESMKGKTKGTDVMSEKLYDLNAPILLPKESVLILELK